jgi:putative aldouronate transport system substrate-binding protein
MAQLSRRQVLVGAGAAALALAGCGSGDDATEEAKPKQDYSKNKTGAMDKYAAGDQFKATEALTFPIMLLSNSAYPYKADWLFWSELAKRTNITLDPTVVPGSDYNQKRSLMISGGSAPSIIPKTYHADEEAYIASGAVLAVSDHLDLMPNFQAKVEKWKLQGDLDQLRQADGKFYLLPGIHEDVWVDYSLAVRTDSLQSLGLSVPKTWDDLHTVLKAMKAAHPTEYPLSDRWSIPTPGGNLLSILSQSYGTLAGWAYQNATWDTASSKFVFTGATAQYKQMLQYVNTLVNEKLLDPETFTQQDDAARQKFSSGRSLVMSCNAQTLVNECRPDIAKIPGATVVKIPQLLGPLGAVKQGSRLESGIMIAKKARDSKDFVAMMQFIDWLWYSDKGGEFAKWGVEGVTFNKDASGKRTLAPDVNVVGLNPKASKHLQVNFGFYNGVFAYGGSTELLESFFSAEEQTFQKEMTSRKTLAVPPPHPLNSDEREMATLWESGLKDYVTQQTLKFILGQRPLSEWDAYVGELKGKSMTSYIDLVNKSYERYKKDHS